MATTTRIEWADATTNTAVGCSHCSPGCDHCYAEKFAHRLSKHPIAAKVYAGVVDERGKWTGKINSNFSEKMYPHRVPGKGKRVFVGSMTDIFHPNYPAENRDELFASILADYIFANGHGHTFIILTKRPQAMEEYFAAGPGTLLRRWGRAGNGWIIVGDGDSETFEEYADGQTIPQEMTSTRDNLRQDYLWPLPNLWLGVTVCNQAEADAKIPVLLETPATKRFVSIEPMLGPVEIGKYLYGSYECAMTCGTRLAFTNPPKKRCTACGFTGPDDYETWGNGDSEICPECGEDGGSGEIEEVCPGCGSFMVREHPDTQNIDWVIAGTETGPKARAADEAWFRSLRDQCHAYHSITPFFLKKNSDGSRLLDGREWNEVPQ